MKLREILKKLDNALFAAGIDNAPMEARIMLEGAYGISKEELIASLDRELCQGAIGGSEPTDIVSCPGDCDGLSKLREMADRRLSHEPLQYILGEAYFCGLKLKVDKSVLIPRPDTECLVEEVLKQEKHKDIRVLDLCTGSGAVALSLKKLGEYEYVLGTDISDEALNIARENARSLGLKVGFIKSDLFDNIGDVKFDVIVSNPPYIRRADIATLMPEVAGFEPEIALDGGRDGLDFYKKIALGAGKHLKRGARLYLEIGYDEGEDVRKLLSNAGFNNIAITKDLNGLDRVVSGTLERLNLAREI